MSVAPELAAMLICPRCRGKLTLGEGGDELICSACSVAYPVTNGMPRLLAEEGRPLGAGKAS